LLLNNKLFFAIIDMCLNCKDVAGPIMRWRPDGEFLAIFAYCIFSEPHAARFRPAS